MMLKKKHPKTRKFDLKTVNRHKTNELTQQAIVINSNKRMTPKSKKLSISSCPVMLLCPGMHCFAPLH